jgi:hypothetical protein
VIAGEISKLAVSWDIVEVIDGWIFGHFLLHIDGNTIGDSTDFSVDLNGCLRWIKDFGTSKMDRYEPGLFEMDKETLFTRLASSVLVSEDPECSVPEVYKNTFSRFHISQIGMSSFDNVTLLLVKDEIGRERCVWKTGNGSVMEAYFEADVLECVLSDVSTAMHDAFAPIAPLAPRNCQNAPP